MMTKSESVIIGSGGLAQMIKLVLKESSSALNYIDLSENKSFEANYLGSDDEFKEHQLFSEYQFYLGVSHIQEGDFSLRKKLINSYLKYGAQFPSLISQFARTASSVSSNGTVLLPFSVVGSHNTIGDFSLINSHCYMDHNCVIGNNVLLMPHVSVEENVTIGDECFIGYGVRLTQGITISSGVVIDSGCVIKESILEPGRYRFNKNGG